MTTDTEDLVRESLEIQRSGRRLYLAMRERWRPEHLRMLANVVARGSDPGPAFLELAAQSAWHQAEQQAKKKR